MPSRKSRTSHPRSERAALVEMLEQRALLTAAVNGIFTDTGETFFDYKQADGGAIRISLFGNVTAEFIGARMPSQNFAPVIRNLVPAGADGDGVNLFSVYVLKADINSVIAIALVPPPTTTTGRPMQPFDGDAGQISVTRAQNPHDVFQVTLGPGQVFLGARTFGFQDQDSNDVPVITPADNRKAFGLRPASAGQLFSGLEVAPGNDLGKFMVGGTITGLVDVPGNMRLFYAGTILTGNAEGVFDDATQSGISNNFFIGGDIEHLICGSSLGTGPDLAADDLEAIQYKTGFDLQINGRAGWIRSLNSFLGSAVIANKSSVTGLGIAQEELEYSGVTLPTMGSDSYFDPQFFGDQASLGDKERNHAYDNDSFDTAQWLGTLFSSDLNSREVIQVRGFTDTIHEDGVDYYAIGLLAGQTAEVQLLGTTSAIAVFDPDGRLIVTDYSNVGVDRFNKPFRFTADRPGPYRIAIANRGDVNFNGIADGTPPTGEGVVSVSPDPYELRILRVGDIAVGGLIADDHIATMDFGGEGIDVLRGDLGSVRAGTFGAGTIYSQSNPWNIANGNFRSMEAISMGVIRGEDGGITIPVGRVTGAALGPDFLVPKGSVGLLRAYGNDPTTSMLRVNESLASPFSDVTRIDPAFAVGGDIQLIDAPLTTVVGNYLANRAIGSIRAFDVALFNLPAPVFAVNVDHRNDDGRIDLIDVSNSFGTLQSGGPAIATGPNGNVRYIHVNTPGVGGDGITDVRDLLVFTDRFFGGGQPQQTIGQPAEPIRLTDDNGTALVLRPIPLIHPIDPNTGFPTVGFDNPGFLRVLTYPVRDKAGVVVVNATAYPGADGSGRGIEVESGARGRGGSVEIGELEVRSPGTNVTFNPFTRAFLSAVTGENSDVLLNGDSRIDVFNVEIRLPASDTTSGSTRLINETSGEIVNALAAHFGSIEGTTIGLAKQSTPAAVNAIDIKSSGYPFNQQRNMIVAGGDAGPNHIVNLTASQGLGNILAGGTIGSVRANRDRRNVVGVFEGINGPIRAVQTATADPVRGNIVSVNIGEGIPSSGTGDVSFSGIYADGLIDAVRGSNADIRGDIVASGRSAITTNAAGQSTPTFIIGSVRLTNGSIIDADIMTVDPGSPDPADDSREFIGPIVIPQRPDPLSAPIFDVGGIRVDGNGGIIGSYFTAEDVGLIQVNGGFGFLSSFISSLGDSVISGIVADGYGIRRSTINGGANVDNVIARGAGKRVPTTEYSSSVRLSENAKNRGFDPNNGFAFDQNNDLHAFLGTSKSVPVIKGINDAGLIEDDVIVGSRELGKMEGYRIQARNVITTNPLTGRKERINFGDSAYPLRVSFGNRARSIIAHHSMNGLSLQAGGIDSLNVTGDVIYSDLRSAGRIQRVTAGALRGTTSIAAEGPEGEIDQISTKGAIFATIDSSVDIGTIRAGTDLGSPHIHVGRHLTTLQVNRSILSGARVEVEGTLTNLLIGNDHQQGATILADSIVTQQIGGQVLGDIIIT